MLWISCKRSCASKAFYEGVELNYDDWASGKRPKVDLWLGTVEHIPEEYGTSVHGYWAPLLRHAISGGDDALLANGKRWRTEETISAEQLVREATRFRRLQPLFTTDAAQN